ncbi:ABC transporter permease [Microscilla marina]|uniref:Efflux ABC transporter, permease protein n=1 Tax=Microscilla marina ATCC 23134 TaxID=313606 RepID=A1ZG66_MICM2|nr:FtsX-like permease family protein [Microscilla marina]EAY30483.1 efflux ABC transporter, permease protein [Microscilla marina ATCC 23134]
MNQPTIKKNAYNFRWLLQMAWRDSRRNLSRLLLFTASIILGIAALVAINSFGNNMRASIDSQSKDLLGADLVISSSQSIDKKTQVKQLIDSLAALGEVSEEVAFLSMIYLPKSQGSRLVRVRALKGNYPFYGKIETLPVSAAQTYSSQQQAIVDNTIMTQYSAKVGDSIRIGRLTFMVAGSIFQIPGQSELSTTAVPIVYFPLKYLSQTNLIKKGSRINYRYYFKLPPSVNLEQLETRVKPLLQQESLRFETVADRKQRVGRVFENLSEFFNLVAFVALLLGCLGVASSVHVYIKGKLKTVAVLRCLGLSGNQAFTIYLLQIALMGFAGAFIGTCLGVLVQVILPEVFSDFLVVDVTMSISFTAVWQGLLTGVVVAVLFGLLPLLSIRKISPLRTLRASVEEKKSSFDPLRWLVILLIVLFIFGFVYFQLQRITPAISFTIALLLAFLLLNGLGRTVMWLVRRFFPVSWSYLWRQSLANLYRPNNQTLILLVSIGLGTALITTLYFTQGLLINRVARSGIEGQPNMVLFDIQNKDKDAVAGIVRKFNLKVQQQMPVVTMRIAKINGRSRKALLDDKQRKIPRWTLYREYRVTYRDTINTELEKVSKGTWQGQVTGANAPIYISVDEQHATRMELSIGDKITFNVQGLMVPTIVGSFRQIKWGSFSPNFLLLFPTGVLEEAPQFHVMMMRVPNTSVSGRFQKALVEKYPGISVIDLGLVVKTIDGVLGQVAFVIQFMALFSILTGLVVLVGSVIISRFQRVQESVLLRTLGASRRQILWINVLEYFFLGSLASLSGIVLAVLSTYALAHFAFKVPFYIHYWSTFAIYFIITAVTIMIGMLNSRGVLNKPPLEVLRNEHA